MSAVNLGLITLRDLCVAGTDIAGALIMDPFSCYERLGMADRTESSMGLSCLVLSHRAPHILCSHTFPPCQVMRAANCFLLSRFSTFVVGTVRVTENGADESKSSIGGAMPYWFLILTLVLCLTGVHFPPLFFFFFSFFPGQVLTLHQPP